MSKHYCLGLSLALTALAVLGSACEPALQRYTFTEPHMGTQWRIVLYAPDEATAQRAAKAAFARIAELDRIMSDYKADSELMRLCKKAGAGPVKVSPDLFRILSRTQEMSRKSQGAFDVTVGPVVRLWRRARRTRRLPDPDELAKAYKLVGYDKVRLDPEARTVMLLVHGMLLDLGGIAKGYAVDAALAILRRHGITRALVAGGGDVGVGAAPPDAQGWKVGIAPLRNPVAEPSHYLLLKNAAVSTAGDTEQYVEIDGKRYSHIIDPRTGKALTVRSSVSVVAHDCTTSDGLDTAACVLGPQAGLTLVEATPGAAALFVREGKNGLETSTSKRFAQYQHP